MKKIIVLICCVFVLQFDLFAQAFTGAGTSANPFRGTLTTNELWDTDEFTNNIVYVGLGGRTPVPDITISTGGSLTINPGVTVIFQIASSDLIIESTGVLTINGSASQRVTLTKASAQPNWGHIFFNLSSNSSTIENCIIEYGKSADAVGGGIYFNSTTASMNVRNTLIRNCDAGIGGYGGGIEVSNSNVVIENCLIYNNIGAGVDIYEGSVNVTNCTIINNNNANDSEYGGIQIGAGSVIIKNSILWNNTNGSTGEMDYSGGGTISYSALTQTVSGTGMIDLSGTNTDPDGPNFIDPATNNYSIQLFSPCRDAGDATGAPALDILGNGRIGTIDIGAYEMQYSRWTGSSSTEWGTAGNWVSNILPSTSLNAVITDVTNNPVISAADATVTNLLVETGGDITIGASRLLTATNLANSGSVSFAPNARGTITNLVNDGSLLLESEAAGTSSGISSLITQNYSGNNPEIELYLGANYHYISSPFSAMSATTEIVDEPNSSAVMEYRENLITNNMNNGWVTTSGYHYDVSTNSWVAGSTTWSAMSPGTGYNYYSNDLYTYTITGSINTANQSVNLAYNSIGQATPDAVQQGYNLLGNPFTSSIDWDDVVTYNSSLFVADVSPAIYFRQGGATIVYLNGITTPSTYNSDGSLIPPMQGFFVKSNLNNASLTIPASARSHSSNKRYKGTSSIPLIRLQIDHSGKSDQAVVRFDEKATTGFDNSFDAYKIFPSSDSPSLSSSIGGVEYTIYGIPYPESSTSIPLAISAPATGSYSINAKEIVELTNYKVYLKDNLLSRTVNLQDNPVYTFETGSGKLNDRFVLEVTTIATSIPENSVSSKPFNIFYNEGKINIQTIGDEWDGKNGDIRIFDLSGKVLSAKDNVYLEKGNISSFGLKSRQGIYIVEIRSGALRFVGKTVLN